MSLSDLGEVTMLTLLLSSLMGIGGALQDAPGMTVAQTYCYTDRCYWSDGRPYSGPRVRIERGREVFDDATCWRNTYAAPAYWVSFQADRETWFCADPRRDDQGRVRAWPAANYRFPVPSQQAAAAPRSAANSASMSGPATSTAPRSDALSDAEYRARVEAVTARALANIDSSAIARRTIFALDTTLPGTNASMLQSRGQSMCYGALDEAAEIATGREQEDLDEELTYLSEEIMNDDDPAAEAEGRRIWRRIAPTCRSVIRRHWGQDTP